MRRGLLRLLLLVAIAVAAVWLAVDPSPEPLIAVIMGAVALLSLGRPDAGDETAPAIEGGAVPGAGSAEGRIAVLPLRHISEDEGRAYFADGLTEELITVLSRVRALSVISAASTSQYRNTSRSLSEIARELRSASVLEGSVRSTEAHLRVSVRLVDANTETTLWSGDFDREFREIFAVQREIAEAVAETLEAVVRAEDRALLRETPTSNLEAYDLYLLGLHHLGARSDEGIRRSIELFRAAAGEDPSFAAAYAGVAMAYVLAAIGYAPIPAAEAAVEARAAADRALALQETLADAHIAKGFLLMNFDRDWPGATAEFERALELNPSEPRAYQWYAQCLSYQGDPAKAIPLTKRAMDLDPRSPLIATEAGWPYFYLGRWEEAAECFRHALTLDPDFALAHFNLGNVLEARGDLPGALERYERATSLARGVPMFEAFAARAAALMGRVEEARERLGSVIAAAEAGASLSVYVAHAFEGMGDADEALRWLGTAVEEDELLVIAIGSTWMPFSSLRDDARYQALLARAPRRPLARPSP